MRFLQFLFNLIIFPLGLFLFLPVALAVDGTERMPSLPDSLIKNINDADLRNWLCLESEISGQPLISKVFALENWLKPALNDLKSSGLTLKWEDYQLSAEDLKNQQNQICQATTGEQALKNTQNFYQQITTGRDKFKRDFARDFNTWANQLLKDTSDSKEKFDQNTRPRLEELRLNAQTNFETQVKNAWDLQRQKLIEDLKLEAEAQFADLKNDDPETAKNRAWEYFKEHWSSDIQSAQREFLLAINTQTKNGQEDLSKQMNDLIAQDSEAQKILATEKLQNFLSNSEANLIMATSSVETTKNKELIKVKKKILAQVITAQLSEAQQVIDERAEKLAAARELNDQIFSAEIWRQKIKSDEQDLLNILDNGDLNREKNLQLSGIFEDKWNVLRQQLEAAEFQSARAILISANRTLNQAKVSKNLKKLRGILKQNIIIRQNNEKRCKAQDKNFSAEVSAFQKCVICQSVVSSEEQKALEEAQNLQLKLTAALKKIQTLSDMTAPYRGFSNAEAENFKNQTQQALSDFYRAEQKYLEVYSGYNNNLSYLSQKCAYLENNVSKK